MYRKYNYEKSGNMYSVTLSTNKGRTRIITGTVPKSVPKEFETDYINMSIGMRHQGIQKHERLRALDAMIGGTSDAILSHAQRR